jgi:hypothetical protein
VIRRRGNLRRMPGTPPSRRLTTRRRLLHAAAGLLAATFALPSCITSALWEHTPPRQEPFEVDRLAVFPIGADGPARPAAGCEALAVRLPEPARQWLAEQGVEGGGEWLLLRPVGQDHERTQRILWPRTQKLAIWLVQEAGDPIVRWRVGELDLIEWPVYTVGTDCAATFQPEPPPGLAPELPEAQLTHAKIHSRSPLAVRVALTPFTMVADALVITGAAAAVVVGACAVVVASPVLLVIHLCSSDD